MFRPSGPFSWLPHILSRGNNGKWKPLCINGSVTLRESGGGGGDNKLRWKYSDGGALIITFQPLPSSQSHPGGYSLLCPIRCSALHILICWCINVSRNIFFLKDNYSRQVKSNPYKRHVFCSPILVTSRSRINIWILCQVLLPQHGRREDEEVFVTLSSSYSFQESTAVEEVSNTGRRSKWELWCCDDLRKSFFVLFIETCSTESSKSSAFPPRANTSPSTPARRTWGPIMAF